MQRKTKHGGAEGRSLCLRATSGDVVLYPSSRACYRFTAMFFDVSQLEPGDLVPTSYRTRFALVSDMISTSWSNNLLSISIDVRSNQFANFMKKLSNLQRLRMPFGGLSMIRLLDLLPRKELQCLTFTEKPSNPAVPVGADYRDYISKHAEFPFPCLCELVMDFCGSVRDEDLAVIVHEAPRLITVSLKSCYRVTSEGIITLSKGCPELER